MRTTQYLSAEAYRRRAREGRAPDGIVRLAVEAEVRALHRDRQVRFRITTGAPDRMKDTVDPKGWVLTAYRRNPVLLWSHQYTDLPIGKTVDIQSDDRGLLAVAQFATKEEYAFADTVYQLILGGYLNATSVGFKPLKHVYNEARGGVDFLEQELLEVSVCPVPANAEALVEGRSIDLGPLRSWLQRQPGGEEPAIVLIDDAPEEFVLRIPDEPRVRVNPADIQAALALVIRQEARRQFNKLRGRIDDGD
jgi:HK97 family phage prohead protease